MKHQAIFGLLVSATAAMLTTAVALAGGDKVAFPADYAKGVLYGSVDRADNKQFRELYGPAEAVAAAKAGKPMPDGTVLTLVIFKAKLEADGNPVKGADGHFVKDEISGFLVMEKRAGWGAEYPADKRNGEWEYQVFTPTMAVNDKANLGNCFSCHKSVESSDYLFTLDKMKVFQPAR